MTATPVLAPATTPFIADSLQNIMSGMMTERDKSSADRFIEWFIDDAELEAMYRNDWVSQKIVNVPADDMVREWRTWQGDKKQVAVMFDLEKRFDLVRKIKRAKQWQRLFGGAAIIIGDGSADPMKPLEIDSMGKESIKYMHVVSRKRLLPGDFENDIESENFGNPKFFRLRTRGDNVNVHHSRVIAFRGIQAPDTDQELDWWGDSVLRAVYDAIRHSARAAGGFAALIDDAITDKVKTPALNDALSNPDDEKRFNKRYSLAQTGKSLFKMLLLGEDETWERSQINFTNFEPILMAYLQIVAGSADIPATRMLSQSPKGMNATGDSDTRNYYDMIASRQESELSPEMHPLDRMLMRHAFGNEPEQLYATWNELWQETPKEKSEINLNNAKAAQIHALLGMDSEILAAAIESQLIEDEVYPGLESAIERIRGEGKEPPPLNFEDPDQVAEEEEAMDRALLDARPRTLYVYRPVKNAKDIIAWAKKQGFKTTLRPEDMHVTICYSRAAVDWFKVYEANGTIEIEAGGPRAVETFDKGATVLLFTSWLVKSRHREFLRIGATHDFKSYEPHITISYQNAPADLSKVEPYQGPIILGPEKFEELRDGFSVGIIEDAKKREG